MKKDHDIPTSSVPSSSVILAVIWVLAFCAFFFCFFDHLPNRPQYSRMDLIKLLPFNLLENIDPQPPNGQPLPSWKYFPQRLDLLAIAAIILSAAYCIGKLVLRVVRVDYSDATLERTVIAFGLGLSALSLITLVCGLLGLLQRALLGGLIAASIIVELCLCLGTLKRTRKTNSNPTTKKDRHHDSGEFVSYRSVKIAVVVIAIVPFLIAMLLGSMLPPTDFDVKEYHLQGPKEFFQAGRITMLPHNVYTSFPFLTEMLSLLGMVLRNDWYWGALAGKAVLMSFAPLTALALFAAGRRWFSPTVGLLAALIHLTTPWTYRISIIAYAEGGLTLFLVAASLATALALERMRARQDCYRHLFVAGLLAGSAMACKYPGLVQVVLPLAIVVIATPKLLKIDHGDRRRLALRSAAVFGVGTAITIGPWLLKNLVETGNPVYPLAYSVFGGKDWDDDVNARWKKGHSPDTYSPVDLGIKFIDVTAKSDWQSPLLFAFAPLALVPGLAWRRKSVALWLFVGFLFFAWWILTHRIDRFWIPMIPIVSLLAAIGAAWSANKFWRYVVTAVFAFCVVFNLGFITTGLCGNNSYLAEFSHVRDFYERVSEPGIHFLNQMSIPAGSKVLCVGAAAVFDARFPVVYNTVFDESIFEQWCGQSGGDSKSKQMRPPDEIRATLKANNISYIYVNWAEILRYRPTYGYSDFVTPARFEWLRDHGIIGDSLTLPKQYQLFEKLSASDQDEIESWATELKLRVERQTAFVASQIFRVRE